MPGSAPSDRPAPGGTDLVGSLLARCSFAPPGTPVDCAVSGGPDSLALLVLAAAAGCEVTAWFVDHDNRPGSADGAPVVVAAAARWGARVETVVASTPPGPNFEARARHLRYGALPAGVLTGHTADDQAETVLLNLMRGAALDGLAGMSPENRPLLALRRTETRALCEAVGLHPLDDPTNTDPTFRRNRVRHELLPLLDDIAERDVAAVIARQTTIVRDAVAHLDDAAAPLDATDARALAAAPVALARIAVRHWIAAECGLGHPVAAAAVERILAVARGEARAADVADGWSVRRTDSRLRLEPG